MGRLRRIGWQLPLSISVLLVAVVAVFSWRASHEVRRAALAAAAERLEDVSRQLAGLLAQSATQRLVETWRVAEDSAVVRALAIPRGEPPARARAPLERLLRSSEQIAAVGLWDTAGHRLLEARRAPPPEAAVVSGAFPAWAVGDTAAVSGFRSAGDVVWFDVAAAVQEGGRTVGYVVQSRRLSSSAQGAQLIADLIGMDAAFVVGEPGGTWTNLSGVVDGPPAAAARAPGAREYRPAGGAARLGVGTPIADTPWVVWVDFPAALVLERSRAFLSHVLPIGVVIVLLGAAGGWVLSRRVTARLGQVTTVATGIAEGEYGRRLAVGRRDELGELAEAFNVMAARVEDTQHRLEQLVAERTAELRASEEQFRTLATTANDAIITADGRGTIQYFNPGAERAFGYGAQDVLGKPLTVLMPERLREAHRRGLTRYLATGEGRVVGRTVELTGLRADGTEFPVELSLASWSDGRGPAFAAIIRDISARREAEEALRRNAAALEAANSELEAFSYSVSHDLRAPLRSIHGFSQALLEDCRDRLDERGVEYLDRVCAAADRMAQLIDDLLELSRATRRVMRREAVDLSEQARRVAAELQTAAPDREVDFRIADGLVVDGDPRLLELVVRNLLENAWKFTSKQARAVIEVAALDGDERAYFVRDDGAGFDMAYADQLFGAFQRLHPSQEFPGTGVGLALVQRIIHRHGGRVWAQGAVGAGATFYFTLPRP